MPDILHVFDLDYTLVVPDAGANKRSSFFQVHRYEPIGPMVDLFDACPNKVILTNRHPAVGPELEHIWGVPVHCREHDLEWADIQQINTDSARLEAFMAKMAEQKTTKVNAWAQEHERVVFFEDHLRRFNPDTFADNVTAVDPLPIIKQANYPGLTEADVQVLLQGRPGGALWADDLLAHRGME